MEDEFDFGAMVGMHKAAVKALDVQVSQAADGAVQWFKKSISADSFCNIVFLSGSTMYAVMPVPSEGIGVKTGNPEIDNMPGIHMQKGAKFMPDSFVLEQMLALCEANNLVPCFFPMVQESDGSYRPATEGWNLWGVETGRFVDPVRDGGTGLVRVSDWELHRKAVCLVMSHIEEELGGEILFYYDPAPVAPQVFFRDAQGAECCVSVKAYFKGRPPLAQLPVPAALAEKVKGCKHYEASVGYCAKDVRDGRPYRTEKLLIQFDGLHERR